MQLLAETCEAIAGTSKKNEKVAIVAQYLRRRSVEEAAVSAVFLCGRPFPAWEEATLQVGSSLLWRVLGELSGADDAQLSAAYRRHGDLGAAAYDVLSHKAAPPGSLNVLEVEQTFRQIAAARGPAAKAALLSPLLARASALETKYIVKVITGDLRIGLKESLVEESVAAAYEASLNQTQRANMLLGDIGETVRLAAAHRLDQARMRLFHPLGFMLASPAESAEEAWGAFSRAQVEDKYDGIRAQAHCGPDPADPGRTAVRLFSRTRDDITGSFPELLEPLSEFSEDVVLDGEIVAWEKSGGLGRAMPFSELQKRLGRKQVSERLRREVPIAYVVFDVLYAAGELVIDRPLRERNQILERIFAGADARRRVATINPQGRLDFEPGVGEPEGGAPQAQVIRAPVVAADSAAALEELFTLAQARGNEGLMIKDPDSVYTPGRRGRSWLKLKRELATLDVVVTAVEYGHGKRAGILSDYTFAVRDGERLANVGKAYSGLTDAEIAELNEWFLRHTLVDHGFRREVEPGIVLQVAFNAVMRSDRHDGGFALRFPRIARLRPDKSPAEIDTLERVREIYDRQKPASAAG